MSRSPLAYPLTRGVDGDAGGAADLQTDIMRFMAILALCLVAIFALVQSLPMTVETPPQPEIVLAELATPTPLPIEETHIEEPFVEERPPEPEPDNRPITPAPITPAPITAAPASGTQESRPIALTRPQWVSQFQPARPVEPPPAVAESAAATAETTPQPQPQPPSTTAAATPSSTTTPPPKQRGFTLRFESDLALTRLVAAGQVGFYAIDANRAHRMAVSDSRISFWDASTPNSFHEMEAATVPRPVVDALARTGANANSVDWGVTLPGRLRSQLDALMSEHSGGALVINASGNMNLDTS